MMKPTAKATNQMIPSQRIDSNTREHARFDADRNACGTKEFQTLPLFWLDILSFQVS